MRFVQRRNVIVAVSLLVLLSLASTSAHAYADHGLSRLGVTNEIWVGTATTRGTLARLDPDAAAGLLGAPQSITLGEPVGSPTALSWSSERRFARDVATRAIPSSVRIVLYDPEGWLVTPPAERLAPIPAMSAFGALARANGYLPVITPHPSLVLVRGAACGQMTGETLEAAYLRCGIQAASARAADIVEVQAQFLETDPDAYERFVTAAAAQARLANPGVQVISGISTTFTEDPQVLYAAWRSVRGVVDGHYLNVPNGARPAVAVDFARAVLSA
ncbi:MAG TPA: hypothetical protein VHW68_04655 [Actinomycetota bacterium]|nr:hypothetical protein [Actinomycetota bacterium]